MQAIVQRRYGTVPEEVLRLERIARPRPAAGEVLVKVLAAGVGRGTWHVMAGQPYLMRLGHGFRAPRNRVPGLDVAGTVVATGPGATRFAVGDEVFGIARGSFLVRAIGADHVIDYRTTDFTDGRQRYDLILDIAGNTPLSRLRRALTPRGTLVIAGGEGATSKRAQWTGIGRQLRAVALRLHAGQVRGKLVIEI